MQCYSLCKRLQQEFPHDVVEVIDYHMPKVQQYYDVSAKKYLFEGNLLNTAKRLLILLRQPCLIHQRKARQRAFEQCMDTLPLSDEKILDDGSERLFSFINENYDVVVAGSDVIWNYNLRGFPNPYFLSDRIHIPKLTYAASCDGMVYEKIPDVERKEIGRILNSYSFLGVRDDESAQFARQMGCSVPTVHTCDPTVFLDVKSLPIDMAALKKKMMRRGFDFTKPSIGVMSGNKKCQMVRRMYGSKYQIVALQAPSIYADVNLHDLSPFEWSGVFAFFKLTITSFFHGTLLSLRHGVPVIAIALESEYSKTHSTKVQDFLRRVDMEDCYFHTDYRDDEIETIKQKSDQLLNSDMRDMILERMDEEAQSADACIQQIKCLQQDL